MRGSIINKVRYKIKYLKLSAKSILDIMNSGLKLILGIVVFLIGLYWYVPGNLVNMFFNRSAFQAFLVVFEGLFGLFLIFIGLIIAWIEFEDIKWEKREKKVKK